MLWVSLIGLVFGIGLGLVYSVPIPVIYAKYLGLAILASFDSLLGGLRAGFEHSFDRNVFLTGFFFNGAVAALLSYLGDRIGVEIYLAVIFVFGARIFNNLAVLRRYALSWLQTRSKK